MDGRTVDGIKKADEDEDEECCDDGGKVKGRTMQRLLSCCSAAWELYDAFVFTRPYQLMPQRVSPARKMISNRRDQQQHSNECIAVVQLGLGGPIKGDNNIPGGI